MTALTNEGIKNIQKILTNYASASVPAEWIRENEVTFASSVSDFYEEANSGSISDTSPRDVLVDTFAAILTGMHWPRNGDSERYKDEFRSAYFTRLDALGFSFDSYE